MDAHIRNPHARKHPWLIAIGILAGLFILFVGLVILWFVLAMRNLTF